MPQERRKMNDFAVVFSAIEAGMFSSSPKEATRDAVIEFMISTIFVHLQGSSIFLHRGESE